MKRFFLASLMGMLICSLAFGVDIKSQIGTQDLNMDADGAAHGTFQRRTSTGGTITLDKIDGNQIPWSNAGTGTIRPKHIIGPGTGNQSGFDNGTFTGTLSAPKIGNASYTDNGSFGDLITRGPWVDVRAGYGTSLKATCNGVTEDNVALQSIIDNVPNGTKLLIPGVCKVTGELSFSNKHYLTLEGLSWSNNGTPITSSGILCYGNGGRSCLWLVGSTYLTMRNIEISSIATTPPKAVIAIGRNASGASSFNLFDHIRVTGYATQALVYSIAAEINTWNTPSLQLVGGGAKYVFYTSQVDDLSLGGLTGSTNLSLFMNNFHIWNLVADDNAAGIYINGRGSTGDMYFRNGSGATEQGAAIQINVVNDADDTAFGPFVFESIRMENTGTTTYGIRLTADAGVSNPTVQRLTARDLNFDPSDSLIYSQDGITLYDFEGGNLKTTGLSSKILNLYNLQRGILFRTSGIPSTIRGNTYGATFSQAGAITFGITPYNTLVQADYFILGLKYYGPFQIETRSQGIDNTYFQQFYGNSAADTSMNISTAADNTFTYAGKIRVNINGADRWIRFDSAP